MDINVEKENEVTIVSLNGRLDAGTAPALEEKLNGIAGEGETKVLVDCRELDYISSAGLRVLLAMAKKFKKNNGQIALCTMSPAVKQVFEISGFTSIFPIYANRDEALKGMA